MMCSMCPSANVKTLWVCRKCRKYNCRHMLWKCGDCGANRYEWQDKITKKGDQS